MSKTILIIDDEKDIVSLYSEVLNQSGYKVITASDGDKALESLKKNKVDLIILDLFMPNMPGLIFLEKMKQNKEYQSIKTIIISVHTPDEKLKRMLLSEKNVQAFLEKPVSITTLKRMVKRYIG
jgi:CheY-like chemotaxis protein